METERPTFASGESSAISFIGTFSNETEAARVPPRLFGAGQTPLLWIFPMEMQTTTVTEKRIYVFIVLRATHITRSLSGGPATARRLRIPLAVPVMPSSH